jgi:ABC-type glycerol-3-phosphate transport system substrate-binding protein
MPRLSAVAALTLALMLAACGESKEDKAQTAVCSARADIKAQVDELKGMSVTTATLDAVRANLKAIRDSLAKIATAQRDLTDERKQAAQKATQTFKSEVSGVTRELVTSVSLADGKQQIQAALDGLASGYQAAFAPLDCS